MSVTAWLNRPGAISRFWQPAYEAGYQCLKGAVTFILGPVYRVRRVGPPPRLPEGGVVLCPNHASYLDPGFVQILLRRRLVFVMTDDFYQSPWGRWFFHLVGAVPVGRGRQARKGLRRAIAHVKRGHAIVVFPEGRLTRDGHLGRGQRGVGVLARRTGAPIYPVGIAGAIHAWSRGSKRPGRARVRVAFGSPMRWSDSEDMRQREAEQAFADRLMNEIAAVKSWAQKKAPQKGDLPAFPAGLQANESSGR